MVCTIPRIRSFSCVKIPTFLLRKRKKETGSIQRLRGRWIIIECTASCCVRWHLCNINKIQVWIEIAVEGIWIHQWENLFLIALVVVSFLLFFWLFLTRRSNGRNSRKYRFYFYFIRRRMERKTCWRIWWI